MRSCPLIIQTARCTSGSYGLPHLRHSNLHLRANGFNRLNNNHLLHATSTLFMLTTLQSKARARRSTTTTTTYFSSASSPNPRPICNSSAQEPHIEELAKVRFKGLETRAKHVHQSSLLRFCSTLVGSLVIANADILLSLDTLLSSRNSESPIETRFNSMVFNMCFPKSGGNSLARSTGEERKKNMEIEKMIRKDKKTQARQVKILLLGAGESGKSTILKQMRIIYSEGFRMDERKEVRQVIFSNMIVAFKIIAEEMRELGLEYENAKSQVHPCLWSIYVSLC